MEDTYKIEIVSPEKVIFSDKNVREVILPSYEGEIGILKDHISIVSFLRPGIVKILKSSENVKDVSKKFLDNLNKDTQDRLTDKDISDHDSYTLNHKLEVIKEIRV